MADIPAMTLPGTTLAATDPYAQGLFAPANPAVSIDVLNGDMQEANYAGGNDTIPPWAVQTGSFMEAIDLPFSEWVYVYGLQLSAASSGALAGDRIVMSQYAAAFYLPWDASSVEVNLHGYARQDASEYETGLAGRKIEYFDLAVYYDGSVIQGLYTRFPHGRSYVSTASANPLQYLVAAVATDGNLQMAANRWRYFDKTWLWNNATHASRCAKGLHVFKVTTWAFLITPDQQTNKLLLPSGGINVVAYR